VRAGHPVTELRDRLNDNDPSVRGEAKTRATWCDHQRMLCGIHHTPPAKPSRSNEGQRSPHATSSPQLRKRSHAMRSIAPSSCAE
jgi:hypothetical protein